MALTLLRNFSTDEILGWSPVRFAEETEHWESVELILIEGGSASDLAVTKRKLLESERAASILGELCRRRLARLLSFALEQRPSLARALLSLGRTPLHEAARAGCPATVRCLLAAGADASAADEHGMTPLHEAAAHANDYAVRIILDAGAAFEAADNGGRTALHYASRSGSAACIQLLLGKGAAVNQASSDGCTALHEAATSPSVHSVRLLLDAGADKQAKSASGWTALHWAASRGRLYAVLVLLEAGLPVDAKTVDEETPLHLAATLELSDVWEALVAAGADEGAVDKNGQTPKERAAKKSVPAATGCDTAGTNTSDASQDQPRAAPGVSNDSLSAPNNDVCDLVVLSAENSSVPLSSVPQNSAAQVTSTSQEDKGTAVVCVPAASGQRDDEGRVSHKASTSNMCESEEPNIENVTMALSSVALNPTNRHTARDSQEDEGSGADCMSAVSDQRTVSECSSLFEEHSELGDATGSADETDSGEQSESGEETDSGDETASDEETDSGDETESGTDDDDDPDHVSSANEEMDKNSERGSCNELFSDVLTKNSVLYYKGPPLFQPLGTVGTSSKYSQQVTNFRGKFRGRGRGAPRGSRWSKTAFTTRSGASAPRKENISESSNSQGSGRDDRSGDKGIRKANFSGSISRGGSIQPHTKEQPSMKNEYRNKEPKTIESKKIKKMKHSKSLPQQQEDSIMKHKQKTRPDFQITDRHHSNQHGIHHTRKRHGEVHNGNQQSEVLHVNRHGIGYHGNQRSEGHHGIRHGESQRGYRYSESDRGNQHGAAHHSSLYGGQYVIQYDEGRNGYYVNQQGECHAAKWHGKGRGGKSHGRGRGGKN